MTLKHLKIFVKVCETGSVTQAAEKLFLAQPSVSLAISELENYYGIKLFERFSKRLHITESGKRFLQYATHIVSLFENMEKEVKNFDAIGVIRIGTSVTIGNYLIPRYIKAFREKHPQMEIKTIIDNSDTIEQHVIDNHIDLGLIEGKIHSPYIKAQVFREDNLVLISSLEHPLAKTENITIDMLRNQDFLLREKGSAVREIFDYIMLSNNVDVNPILESISTEAIIRFTSANLGLALLPNMLVRDAVKRKEVKILEVKDVSFTRNFSIIYHVNKFLTKSAQDFIDLCH